MRNLIQSFAVWLMIKTSSEKEENMLAILFASRIINGKSTFADVPAKLRKQVAENLLDGGLPELVPVEFGGTMGAE